jgi:hypothetical protein
MGMRISGICQGRRVRYARNRGALLEKEPAKGYGLIVAFGLDLDGRD